MSHARMPGPFGLELLGEIGVAFFGRNGDGERDEMKSTPDRFVDAAKRRLMIAGDDQLERGPVLEEILAHETGRDGVAAGELLDPRFGPASALLGFGRGDEAGAAEAGEVGRVTIAVARREGLDRRCLVVVAE